MVFSWDLRHILSSHEELGFLPPLLLLWMPIYELSRPVRLPQTTAVLDYEVHFPCSTWVPVFFTGRRTDLGKGGTFSPPLLGADAPIHRFTYRYSFVFSFRGLLCSGGQQVTKQNRPLQFGTRLLGPLCRLYGQVNHVTIHTVHLRRRSQLRTKKSDSHLNKNKSIQWI